MTDLKIYEFVFLIWAVDYTETWVKTFFPIQTKKMTVTNPKQGQFWFQFLLHCDRIALVQNPPSQLHIKYPMFWLVDKIWYG